MEPQLRLRPREQVSCDVDDDVEVLGESPISHAQPERRPEDKLLMSDSRSNASSSAAISIDLHHPDMMDAGYHDSDSSASESVSKTEPNAPLTGIKAVSIIALLPSRFEDSDDRQLPSVNNPNHPPPDPSSSQPSSAQRSRASSFAPAPLVGQKLDDVALSPPPSLATMDGDEDEWDFADTTDENPAEEGCEEWENIDSSVYDFATGTMQELPSVVYADENFRQTATKFMEMYAEKYTPSEDTQQKFYKTMQTLRFIGEFGYQCVKEPLADWADNIAVKLLDLPLDEASSQLTTELLSYFPENTRAAYQRLRG